MIKQIKPEQLKVGMFISGMNISWFQTPFLSHSFLVTSEKQIEKIIGLKLKEVFIDTGKGIDTGQNPEVPPQSPVAVSTEVKKSTESEKRQHIVQDYEDFHKELFQATAIKKEMEKTLKRVMTDIKLGKSLKPDQLVPVVDTMVDSVYRNQYAIASLGRLKTYNEYTFNHSVNVAILSASFGRFIDLPKEDVTMLGMGGLLHDIGKTRIPEHLLNKSGAVTQEELKTIKLHVEYGVEMLREQNIPPQAVECVAQHHERGDGSGFPMGLKEEDIGIFGKIAAITNLYDTLTSDRGTRPALLPGAAVQLMNSMSGNALCKQYVDKFTLYVGIYPIGTYVLLNTSEVAVVIANNRQKPDMPVLRKIINRQGFRSSSTRMIDLAIEGKKIVRPVAESEYDLPMFSELELPPLEPLAE